MAKSRESSGNMQVITPGERRSSFFSSFVVPFLMVVIILLVAIFFIVKTDGSKEVITDKLGKSLGMDVELAGTRVGWPYVLVLEGVSIKEKDTDKTSIFAKSVRLSKDFKFRTNIFINRGELTLEQSGDGDWGPHTFSRLGNLPTENITQLSKTLDLFDKRIVIDITDSEISWVDKSGSKISSVSGLYFKTLPVKIYKHDMRYFSLSINSGVVNGSKFSDIKKEWLASKDKSYLGLYEDEAAADENEQWGVRTTGGTK